MRSSKTILKKIRLDHPHEHLFLWTPNRPFPDLPWTQWMTTLMWPLYNQQKEKVRLLLVSSLIMACWETESNPFFRSMLSMNVLNLAIVRSLMMVSNVRQFDRVQSVLTEPLWVITGIQYDVVQDGYGNITCFKSFLASHNWAGSTWEKPAT